MIRRIAHYVMQQKWSKIVTQHIFAPLVAYFPIPHNQHHLLSLPSHLFSNCKHVSNFSEKKMLRGRDEEKKLDKVLLVEF